MAFYYLPPVPPKYLVVERLGKIEAKECFYLNFPWEYEIGKVRSVKNPVLIFLKKFDAEARRKKTALCLRDEAVSRVQINIGAVIEQCPEFFIFQSAHMGHDDAHVWILLEELFEMMDAGKLISHRSRTRMNQEPLPVFHKNVIQGTETLIMGIETLNEELQLESKDFWVPDDRGGHIGTILVFRVIGGKAAQVWCLVEDLNIPFVQVFCRALPVSVV
jgi:hypothetical protein